MTTEIALRKETPTERLEFQVKIFEFYHRRAKMLAASSLVPSQYRNFIERKKGKDVTYEENPFAVPNCIIAMEIAERMGLIDTLVMQNLYIIDGRPAWYSKFVRAIINSTGRFEPLSFEEVDLGKKEVSYHQTVWNDGQPSTVIKKVTINDMSFVCVTKCLKTGKEMRGPTVTIEMAVKEGWYTKNGSKWPNMPQIMGQNRASSFFGNIHCPDALMGFSTTDEADDIREVVLERNNEGVYEEVKKEVEPDNAVDKLKEKIKKEKKPQVEEIVIPESVVAEAQEVVDEVLAAAAEPVDEERAAIQEEDQQFLFMEADDSSNEVEFN